MSKITDLVINKDFTFSLEITPNISVESLKTLSVEPSFFAITWHAKSHRCEGLDIAPLKLASRLAGEGKNVLLHLTCDLLRTTFLDALLAFLQEKAIRNLLVVLGENYDPSSSDFKTSNNLIRYIKQKYGSDFCIGVAGFPGCSDAEFTILKAKMDEGADFVITQAVFLSEEYQTFVDKCTQMSINAPIIPGLFLYGTDTDLMGFANLCKVKVPQDLQLVAKEEGNGKYIIKKLIQDISAIGTTANHFHFFTMNKLEEVLSLIGEMLANHHRG